MLYKSCSWNEWEGGKRGIEIQVAGLHACLSALIMLMWTAGAPQDVSCHYSPPGANEYRAAQCFLNRLFPHAREDHKCCASVCVCVRQRVRDMSLCISPCLCEAGGVINRSARQWRWANEQAKAYFCVCLKPTTSLWGIFSLVFRHLPRGLFLIQSTICSSHALSNNIYTVHRHGDAHLMYSSKHAHYSFQLIPPEASPSWDLNFPSNKSRVKYPFYV